MAKQQVTVSLDSRFLDWLDEGMKSLRFATRSHGIEYCIDQVMQADQNKTGEQGKNAEALTLLA